MKVCQVERSARTTHVYGTPCDLSVGDIVVFDVNGLTFPTKCFVALVVPKVKYVRLELLDEHDPPAILFGTGIELKAAD